jgi:hypothetical protein
VSTYFGIVTPALIGKFPVTELRELLGRSASFRDHLFGIHQRSAECGHWCNHQAFRVRSLRREGDPLCLFEYQGQRQRE